MAPTDARAAIVDVMERHPDLTDQGFERPGRRGFDHHRADMLHPFAVKQFEYARAWLSAVPKRSAPNRDYGHSYGLKHVVEKWAGSYVSNGMLIAAALHLGLPIARCPSNINCWVGVASRRKWPVRDAALGGRTLGRVLIIAQMSGLGG
jgi:hypothetical protein